MEFASLADRAPEVLQKYFQNSSTFLTLHHINTYEKCVLDEIPEIIYSENPIVVLKEPLEPEKGIYKYKTEIFVGGQADVPENLAIHVGAPIVTLDDGKTVRRMFPNEARLRNLTYASQFSADILIRLTFTMQGEDGKYQSITRELPVIEQFPLFRIPILLRSKLCATFGASPEMLTEMGECRNDQGGYFVVDGAEKVLITRQKQSVNSLYVAKKSEKDPKLATFAQVDCQHPVSKQVRRVCLYRLRGNKSVEDGAIRVSIPFVKGTLPLFVLFRAMGVESDEEIVRMILPSSNPLGEASLIASIHDAWPITTQGHAIEFIRTLTKEFIPEHVLNILRTYLFAHVPDRPLARAQYLAEIVRKMIRVEQGQEPATNRDDIRTQRLLPAGILLRGLFGECWKMWKKAVIHAVDIQYNYNRSMYQDENFLQLFSLSNLPRILSTTTLNDAIMRGFRGKWGTNQYNTEVGVVQPLARISYMDSVSHTRRIVSDFDVSMKLVGPRQLHTSQVGYFCTSETPTGAHIGATKNYSILTTVSISAHMEPVMEWMLERGGVVEVAMAPRSLIQTAFSVQINGGTIGFTQRPDLLVNVLKLMKWTGCLCPHASISFNTVDGIVRIYLDDGRPLRPLWHLNNGEWPAMASLPEMPSWRDLLMGTLPTTRHLPLTSTEFVDPLADKVAPTLEEYIDALAPHVGGIEYVDPYEGNEAFVSWWGAKADLTPQHTHAEIHPSSLMGAMASMIPYAPHNQSPRNQLSCSQSKQGIGYYATNYENRFDTYGSMLCYGEGAICRTIYHDAIAGGGMPYGTNLIFAINSFNGYNQDDGILFNRSSIERGMFRSLALRSYETQEEDDQKVVYRIGNPKYVLSWTDLKPGYDYTGLDENGIIREGTIIHDKTVLVGRYMTMRETGQVKDSSVLPTVFTKGRVDKVVVLHQANGLRLVKVRILEERVPELGDKYSTRHGQKGTMGMLLDAVDMPRTADGMVPDVMVNPHCIPSRMTMAQMLEQLFGRLGAEVGAKINATSFMNDDQSLNAMGNALEMLGIHKTGEEIMYSGITGKMFSTSVFMGPMHFMRLKHLAQDKINARGAGRREVRTHQPTGGRGNEGGMRIGEMERDVLIAHGITGFLQESMMKRSDGTSFWICNGCGTIPVVNEAEGLFVCPLCDGPLQYQGVTAETIGLVLPTNKSRVTFSKVEMPYALKLLDHELETFMNAGFRFVTAKTARGFREPTMDIWSPSEKENVSEAGLLQTVFGLNEVKEEKPVQIEPVVVPKVEEEGPADMEDEGQPAHNEGKPVEPDSGQAVIDFDAKSKQYKEFSTYYPMKLEMAGKVWPSVEHYFQAMKFPTAPDYQEEIRKAKTPAQAKKMGSSKDYAPRSDWASVRDDIMLEAIRAKFSQEPLKGKLLETKAALLRHSSAQDNYWGIGRSGRGMNKLGQILMKVRKELREETNATEAPTSVMIDVEGVGPIVTNEVPPTIVIEELPEPVVPEPPVESEPQKQDGGEQQYDASDQIKVIKL